MKKIVKAVEKVKREYGGVVGNLAMQGRRAADLDIRSVELSSRQLRKNLVLRGDEMESATMAYNMLRTQLYRVLSENGWTSIGITSANKGEGKSLTSINLAYSLARSVQQSVILVDLDLRRPSISKKLNIEPAVGVGDYFTKNVPLTDVMFTPGIEGFVIAPGRGSLDNASELLGAGRLLHLINEIGHKFPSRFVIYDLPPTLLVDDVMVAAEYIDSFLLVATEGETKKEELKRAVELLEPHNLLGVVLNKSGESGHGGYYDYYYGED